MKNKVGNTTRAPTDKRGAYNNKQSPGEFPVLFQRIVCVSNCCSCIGTESSSYCYWQAQTVVKDKAAMLANAAIQ